MTTHRQQVTALLPPLRLNDSRVLKDVVAPPIVTEGRLLVTRPNVLDAFEESSGNLLWTIPLSVTERLEPHGGVPLVVENLVYVRSGDELIVAELKSGEIHSRAKTPQLDLVNGAFIDGCLVSYTSAYTLEAWDLETNASRWSIQSDFNPIRLVATGDLVIVGGLGSISAYGISDGSQSWTIELDEDSGIGGLAVAPDGSLLAATGPEVLSIDVVKGEARWRAIADVTRPGTFAVTNEGEIHLLDLRRYRRLSADSGIELSSKQLSREQMPKVRGALGSISVSNTHVFAADLRGPIIAISRTGEVDWKWQEERSRAASVAPVLSDNRLYALALDGTLQCFEQVDD